MGQTMKDFALLYHKMRIFKECFPDLKIPYQFFMNMQFLKVIQEGKRALD